MRKLLNITFSITLLLISLYILDWNIILDSLEKLNLSILLGALLICTLQYIFLSCRWYFLVKSITFLSYYQHVWRYFIATFANAFTPANIGGDVYRAISLRPHVDRMSHIVIMLMRERIIGLLSFLILYSLCFFYYSIITYNDDVDTQLVFIYFSLLSFVGVIAGLYSPIIAGVILQFKIFKKFKAIESFTAQIQSVYVFSSMKEFIILMGLSFGAFILWIIPIQMIAAQVGVELTLYEIGMIAAMVELVRLVPITVQGIGLREGAFAYFVSLFGQQAEAGFALGAIVYIILSISIVLSGLIGWSLSLLSSDQENV